MKVKNVSKKIIGNSQFRLLPGDTMLVTGKEAWVKNYLSEESIVEVKESAPESVESGEKKAESEPDTPVNAAENSEKAQETPASADTARGRSGKKPADKT